LKLWGNRKGGALLKKTVEFVREGLSITIRNLGIQREGKLKRNFCGNRRAAGKSPAKRGEWGENPGNQKANRRIKETFSRVTRGMDKSREREEIRSNR